MFELGARSLEAYLATGAWRAPVTALLAAFVFGQVLAWVYELTYRGLSYSRGFSQSLVLASISAAALVLAMSHSLIAGVGLFGVLSMIRFRTNLKTPRDLTFMMGAATTGVAVGVGALAVGLLGAATFSAVSLYMHVGGFGSRERFDGVLRFRVSSDVELGPRLRAVLRRYCRRHTLLSVGEVAQGSRVEHAYQVKFWGDVERDDLLAALRDDLGVSEARLLLQDAALEY